ncbi:MAG: ATP synthase F1 subunit delta [Acetobacter sp.]|nr:ATP synthase F1 subunit delta [Acetobacter sp.]
MDVLQSACIAFGRLEGRYATALYDIAVEQDQLSLVLEESQALIRLIDENSSLRAVLHDQRLDVCVVRKAVIAVLEKCGFNKIIQNFVGVVANNRRLSLLRSILIALGELAVHRRGDVLVEVGSTVPLLASQREQIKENLTRAGYSRVTIHEFIDPSLLGGLVVRVGTKLYDSSVKARLFRLRYAMKGVA